MESPVILFDGVCGLCHRAVRFILRRDPHARFRFAAAQSTAGRALLDRHGMDTTRIDTLVLIEGGQAFTKSAAVLRIGQRLGPFWRLMAGLGRLVPLRWRDRIYDRVATTRYERYGKLASCPSPGHEVRDRFLS